MTKYTKINSENTVALYFLIFSVISLFLWWTCIAFLSENSWGNSPCLFSLRQDYEWLIIYSICSSICLYRRTFYNTQDNNIPWAGNVGQHAHGTKCRHFNKFPMPLKCWWDVIICLCILKVEKMIKYYSYISFIHKLLSND